MYRNSTVSFELKLKTVIDYLNGNISIRQAAKDLKVHDDTVRIWVSLYKSLGEDGLVVTRKGSSYSKELKLAAIQDYLSKKGSYITICEKYGIRSTKQLQEWIMKYNSHEEIKSSCTGGISTMTKGRTTTFEERIEIVKYCIENNKNYKETAVKYQISYQQAQKWTATYEASGVDGLIDRRGKRKSEDQLTEVERLKVQNKLLEAKTKRLEMENEVLKKLEAIERRWY